MGHIGIRHVIKFYETLDCNIAQDGTTFNLLYSVVAHMQGSQIKGNWTGDKRIVAN